MPAKLERCVRHVEQSVTPRNPKQSKKSAAWAICTAQMKKSGKMGAHKMHNPTERIFSKKWFF